MSDNNQTESPALLLAQAHNTFKAQEEQRKRDFEKQLADLVLKVKGQVRDALKQAQSAFNTLDKGAQTTLLAEAAVKKLLATFGHAKPTPKASPKRKSRKSAPRSSLTKESVLEFIKTTGKVTVGQVNANFAGKGAGKASKVTVGNRIKDLKKAKLIVETRAGTTKHLQAT